MRWDPVVTHEKVGDLARSKARHLSMEWDKLTPVKRVQLLIEAREELEQKAVK